MAESGTMVALNLAAIRITSGRLGQMSWYSSPFRLYASRTPPCTALGAAGSAPAADDFTPRKRAGKGAGSNEQLSALL